MNFSLGKTWEKYVADQVESGVFNNASEVVRDALRRQQEQLIRLEALRQDIQAGMDSVKADRLSQATAANVIARAKSKQSG